MSDDHLCSAMMQLDMRPAVRLQEAVDLRSGKTFRAAFVVVPGLTGSASAHIDYCPWCGTPLTDHTLADMYEARLSQTEIEREYADYRRRFVRWGQAGSPLSISEFASIYWEFAELNVLLLYARPEHAESLFRRKQVVRNRLCYGVMWKEERKAVV